MKEILIIIANSNKLYSRTMLYVSKRFVSEAKLLKNDI